MKHAVPLIFVWALTACTTPDVMAPLAQAREEFTAFSTGIEEHLLHDAEEEREREERRAIAADGGVIGFVGDCDTTVARLDASGVSDCRLVEYFDPRDDAGSASELVDFRTIMDGYLTSLEALAGSKTPAQAQAQANAIVAAFGAPDAARPAAFERLGEVAREQQILISTSAGFFVNQLRVGALRRVIGQADAVLEDNLEVILAHLEPYDTDLLEAQARLLTARQNLLNAEGKDDPVAYVEAIENARTAYATFLKAQENSPVINFLQFRKSHAQLLARTRPGANVAEFVKYLEELRGLLDAANEEN